MSKPRPLTIPGVIGGYFQRHPYQGSGLVFFALVLIFFGPRLRGDFMFRDAYHEFLGLRLLWNFARAGQLPMWDPYVALGAPLSGSVYFGLFYPLNWLLSVALRLPPDAAIKVYVLVHFALAGTGMVYLLSRLGAGWPGAWAGAVAYTFGGFAVSQHYAINLLVTPALMPWAAGMMVVAGRDRRWRPALAAGLLTSLILLGGDPQGYGLTILISMAMAAPGFAGEAARAPKESCPRIAGAIFIYLMAAVLGAAVELVPMVTVLGQSARGRGFDFNTATCWSLAPLRVVELVLSRPFGDPWPVDGWWGAFLGERCFPWPLTLSLYLGIWTALGWTAAWRHGLRDRRVAVFTVLAAGSLALALGRNTPLYPMLYDVLPPLRPFRYPEKYMQAAGFALAVLAGLGTDRLLAPAGGDPQKKLRLLAPFAALAATVVVFILFRLGSESIGSLLTPWLGSGASAGISPADAASDLGAALTRSGFFLAAGLTVLAAVKVGRNRAITFAPALVLFLDLWQANSMLAPTAPGLYRMESQLARTIMQREAIGAETADHPFRIFRDPRIMASADLTYERMRRWERDTLRSNLAMIEGFEEFSGQNVAVSERFSWMMERVITFERLSLYSVKYAILAEDRADDLGPAGGLVERYRGAALVELGEVFPRAYWVGTSRWVNGENELAAAYPGHDFRRSVLLEPAEPGGASPDDSLVHNPELLAQEIARRGLNRVEVKVKAPAPGWLVLNDAWYPGWSARVDDRPALIYRANGLVRAVRVGAGEREVVFSYRPPGLVGGGLASGLSWIVGIMVLVFRRGPKELGGGS